MESVSYISGRNVCDFSAHQIITDDASMMLPQAQSTAQRPSWPHRACEECKRKKTKCDMGKPICSLCARVGSECIFPTKRKRPEPRRQGSTKRQRKNDSTDTSFTSDKMLDRLMQLISSAKPSLEHDIRQAQRSTSSESPALSLSSLEMQSVTQEIGPRQHVESNPPQPLATTSFIDHQPDHQLVQPPSNRGEEEYWEHTQAYGTYLDSSSYPSQVLLPDDDVLQWVTRTPIEQTHYEGLQHFGTRLATNSASSATSTSPAARLPASSGDGEYSLTLPDDQVLDLIELFFIKVSNFLPIFHRPRFYAKYLPPGLEQGERFQHMNLEMALILNGILSLSARFSTSPYWTANTPTERGETFAQNAKAIFADATSQEDRIPTLDYLHGCILLAFYHHTNSPSSFGWMLSGVCIRLAYDLGINYVDDDLVRPQPRADYPQWSSAEEWVEREERRRAFWSVWELDAFPSTMSRRPYAVDRNKVQVLLPVSDDRWFAGEPLASAFVGTTPATAWKSLQSSPNQTERAWFLVANCLMVLASDMVEQKRVSPQEKEEMVSVLSCFALSLPDQFRIISNPPVYTDQTFARSNWIMATNIMLTVARTYAALIATTCDGSSPAIESRRSVASMCVQQGHDIVRVVRAWTPEYIAYTTPFIACSLVGPASMHILDGKTSCTEVQIASVDRELVLLAIHEFARYWKIGSLLIDITTTRSKYNAGSPRELTARDKELAVRYASIMPSMETRYRARSVTSC